MEQSPQKSNNMVMVLVVSAMLLAFATYLAINMVTSRPSPTDDPNLQVTAVQVPSLIINGVPIFRNIDPAKEVILVNEINPPPVVPNDQQGGQPTITPIPQGPTPIPPPPPTATRDPNPVIFKPYTVVQGDSLYSIAEAQNSSIGLMALHGIDSGDLVPGNVIERLPYANPAYCPGTRAYVVRDKDTIFRIAAQFGVSVEAIAVLNNLAADYRVDVTQVICIPV